MSQEESNAESFNIQCHDGEKISVSQEQAEILFRKCVYFTNVFRHGTSESKSRTLVKPDWSIETARGLVELLLNEKVDVENISYAKNLLIAADQLLIPLAWRPTNFESLQVTADYLLPLSDNAPHFVLTTAPGIAINGVLWKTLTSKGVTVTKLPLSFVYESERPKSTLRRDLRHSKVSEDSELQRLLAFATNFKSENFENSGSRSQQELLVFFATNCSLAKALHVLGSLLYRTPSIPYQKTVYSEVFRIFFPAAISLFGDAIVNKIAKLSGARGYNHTGNSQGYYCGGKYCPTFIGTWDQLYKALGSVPSRLLIDNGQYCSLQVTEPSLETLEHLVHASYACVANPGTLGVDFGSNAFYAVKTVADMKLLLASLLSHSTPPIANLPEEKGVMTGTERFHLHIVRYPRKVF